MPCQSYATIRSDYMFATHTLPSSEQIQIGGFNSVRGYPEGDYLADLGGYAQFDWYFPMYLIPKSWKSPDMDLPWRNRIEPIFFADAGAGKLKKVLPGEKHMKFLAGFGGGFRIRITRNTVALFEWAKHSGDAPQPGSGTAVFNFYF